MAKKIKIIGEVKEIEGQIEEKGVTPFGTSGHLPVGKKHIGKLVSIIIPTAPKYIWLLTKGELEEITLICKKILSKKEGKLTPYYLEALENIHAIKFNIEDLSKVVTILKESKNHKHLVDKIKRLYNL